MESERRNYLLVEDNFPYYKAKIMLSGEVKWRCTKKNCNGRIYTVEGKETREVVRKEGSHNHPPLSSADIQRKIINAGAKRKVAESDINERPSKIFYSVVEKCETDSLKVNDIVAVKRTIYRARKKIFSKLPKSVQDTDAGVQLMDVESMDARTRRAEKCLQLCTETSVCTSDQPATLQAQIQVCVDPRAQPYDELNSSSQFPKTSHSKDLPKLVKLEFKFMNSQEDEQHLQEDYGALDTLLKEEDLGCFDDTDADVNVEDTNSNTDSMPIASNTDSTPTASDQTGIRPRPTLARKRPATTTVQHKPETVQSKVQRVPDFCREDDEFDLFGKSIAVQLRNMPLERALVCQETLQAVMKQERLYQLHHMS